jgi:hypothetical protein
MDYLRNKRYLFLCDEFFGIIRPRLSVSKREVSLIFTVEEKEKLLKELNGKGTFFLEVTFQHMEYTLTEKRLFCTNYIIR